MLKDLYGKYYFDGNYNCAESVVRAGNEFFDLGLHDRDMKLVGAYGGGMQTGNTCGALLGGIALLSMIYVEQKAHESKDIRPVVTMFTERFKEKYNGTTCEIIKAIEFRPEVRCKACVDFACDALEEVIREFEASKEK